MEIVTFATRTCSIFLSVCSSPFAVVLSTSCGYSSACKIHATRDLLCNLIFLATAAKLAAAQGVSTVPSTAGAPPTASPKGSSDGETEPPSQPAAAETAITNGDATKEPESDNEKDEKIVVEEEKSKKKSEEEEERAKELQKAQDKSRPVSSTPVPGTPW